jgi:mono/diheme cytochrome c family protein
MTKKLFILLIGVGAMFLLSACAPAWPQAPVGQQPGFNQMGLAPVLPVVGQLQPTPLPNNPYNAPSGMNQPYGRGSGWNGNGMRGYGQRGGWNGYDNCMGGYGYSNGYAPGQTFSSGMPSATSQEVSYRADVQPIFNNRCISCHGGAEGLYLDSYTGVINGSMDWPVVIPSDPINSRLIQLVSNGFMPLGGPPLSQAQIQTLVDWVAAGTPNN